MAALSTAAKDYAYAHSECWDDEVLDLARNPDVGELIGDAPPESFSAEHLAHDIGMTPSFEPISLPQASAEAEAEAEAEATLPVAEPKTKAEDEVTKSKCKCKCKKKKAETKTKAKENVDPNVDEAREKEKTEFQNGISFSFSFFRPAPGNEFMAVRKRLRSTPDEAA